MTQADVLVTTLKLKNGLSLEIRHCRKGNPKVVVVAHGFFQNKDTAIFRAITDSFLPDFDVLALDFRGHGKSEGRFTLGARETEDMAGVLEYARWSYDRVGVIGFSLGAAVSIAAAAEEGAMDSLIAVSPPASFRTIDYHFWRPEAFQNLLDNLSPKAKGKGVRLGNPFLAKPDLLESVRRFRRLPVLFVHGTHDWLIRPHHSRELYEAAGEPRAIEMIEKGLHAEKLFEQDPAGFRELTAGWFRKTL